MTHALRRPATGEIRLGRRLFHLLAGSSIPVLGLLLPWAWTVGLLACLSGLAFPLEWLRFRRSRLNVWIFRWLGVLFKESEWRHLTGATYLVVVALVAFLVFPREVAALALLFLSVGDPVAGLVGRHAPGPRLRGKSPLGTVAFLAVAVALAAAVAAGTPLHFGWPLAVGAAVAAAAELSPDPIDDNLKVPLLSGVALILLL